MLSDRGVCVFILLLASIGASAQTPPPAPSHGPSNPDITPKPVTLFLAGDSTMAQKLPEKRPETGWGECLQNFFSEGRVRVDNRAKNGRSTRTFLEEKLWAGLLEDLHSGDYVFIQFGHNDESKEKVDRYTPPEDYRRNLVRFVTEVRERGATAVLLTPLVRRRFDESGKFYDTHGEYPDIVRSVAAEVKAPIIDMQRASRQVLEEYGEERSKTLFLWVEAGQNPNYPDGVKDNTHFNPVGAEIMARLAVQGMCEVQLPLTAHLKQTCAQVAVQQ